jgi:hypothetical protein
MNPITAVTRTRDSNRFDPITTWDAVQPPPKRRDELPPT